MIIIIMIIIIGPGGAGCRASGGAGSSSRSPAPGSRYGWLEIWLARDMVGLRHGELGWLEIGRPCLERVGCSRPGSRELGWLEICPPWLGGARRLSGSSAGPRSRPRSSGCVLKRNTSFLSFHLNSQDLSGAPFSRGHSQKMEGT